MTITRLLAEGYRPSPVAERFLRLIAELEPYHAFVKSAVLPTGTYILPFVDRKGVLQAWVPFNVRPCYGSPVFVEMGHRDPNTVWRVTDSGVVRVAQSVNEDY